MKSLVFAGQMWNGLLPGKTGAHRILEPGGALKLHILYLHCTDQGTKGQRELLTSSNHKLGAKFSDSYLVLVPL